jgi:hypothetical protein
MAGERLARILALLPTTSGELGPASLCRVSAMLADVTGAGIVLMSSDMATTTAYTSDDVSATLDDLQLTLGEGPCVDAHGQGRPVLEPDLADPVERRWPAFSPPAVAAGVRAVFGFPLHVGAARLGTLGLYRDRQGPLSDEQHADALVMAGVVARAVLVMQAQVPPGSLAHAIEADGNFRYVVHQATGMVAAQLGVPVGDALVRLRAHAFRTDRLLTDVAGDVVARRLRFGEDDGDHQPDAGRER